jgi:hypothetical protein
MTMPLFASSNPRDADCPFDFQLRHVAVCNVKWFENRGGFPLSDRGGIVPLIHRELDQYCKICDALF